MTKRQKVEQFIKDYVKKITKDDRNVKLYDELFKSMKDTEFDNFMKDLRDGKLHLNIIVPTGEKTKITVEDNIKIGKELGYDFFQRLTIDNGDGTPRYTTANKTLVYDLPIRRTSQTLTKKISVSDTNNSIDSFTGQVAGGSRTRNITYPEVQVLVGYGLNKTIAELMQARGGDIGMGNAMETLLYRNGNVSLQDLQMYKTGVRSTKVLAQYLLAMHIRSTLQ